MRAALRAPFALVLLPALVVCSRGATGPKQPENPHRIVESYALQSINGRTLPFFLGINPPAEITSSTLVLTADSAFHEVRLTHFYATTGQPAHDGTETFDGTYGVEPDASLRLHFLSPAGLGTRNALRDATTFTIYSDSTFVYRRQ